jgi:hypothetical protein
MSSSIGSRDVWKVGNELHTGHLCPFCPFCGMILRYCPGVDWIREQH